MTWFARPRRWRGFGECEGHVVGGYRATVVVNSPAEGGYYKGSAPVEVDATQPRFAITSVTMAVGQGSAVSLTQTTQWRLQGHHRFQ